MQRFPRLFEPITIGNFTVPNRIVMTSHGSGHSEPRFLRYLQERARGGAGLLGIFAGDGVWDFSLGPGRFDERFAREFDAHPPNPAAAEGIEYYDRTIIPVMRKRAEIVHDEGARCFGQVLSLGAARHRDMLHPAFAPSSVPDPYDAVVPHELAEEEIAQLVLAFGHGIRRLKEAGFDAAEIHGAHGYLVAEFFSPGANRRTDRYGGSRENRVRFAMEVLAAARRLAGPDFPVGIRVGLDGDGRHGGLTVEELTEIGRLLSPHVAYISVSGGTYTGFGDGLELAYVSPWYVPPGHNLNMAACMKKAVQVPVIVAGRITNAAMAESIVAEGSADLVGMVRALIADPELPKKAREGRPEDVRMCLGLDECHYVGAERKPVLCAINAAAGREDEMQLVPASICKTVLVVGAGPAGMEAARVAARRGHRVYLADRERMLGGTVRVLAQDPNRRNLADMTVFFARELKRAGVKLLLGDEVTAEAVQELAPDAVVIATGAVPYIPDIPGIHGPNVLTAIQLLSGAAQVGQQVLVVGGLDDHLGPPTVAELLADQGKVVELLTEHVDLAHGVEAPTRFIVIKRLLQKGVKVSTMHRLTGLEGDTATALQTFAREERRIKRLDTVVLACGRLPDDRLARALKGRVKELHVIGDSLGPRRIMHAVLDGARAGRML